ncbi:hypothetical protein A3L11_08195 [Thermococcus siculi]|uniref:Uncharacterized protein n=1 Tax=Thermococcus siculi TaxID=72803 RepID=A0A2Z2MLG2_9EURY|nr:hypothetical protein [Thermococcus siculi]ASJ09209.1 hypothetical protein A3L11_08195 [Thermococcus siculi]
MEEEALRRKLLELSTRQASLNFKIYELFTCNRTLAMRLSGYAAENRSLGGKGVSEEVQKIIDRYLLPKKRDQQL